MRQAMPAGKILAVMLVCFLLWTLLSARTLKRAADASPQGARRSVALVVLTPFEGLSRLLLLDRAAAGIQSLLGRDANRAGGSALAPLPPLPPAPTDLGPVGPDRPNRPGGDGNGDGRPNGQGPNGEGPKGEDPGHEGPPGNGGPKGEGEPPREGPSPEPDPEFPAETDATPPGPPLRRPTVARPLRVLVVGDSFGEEIGIGLSRLFDPSLIDLQPRALHSTGLARPDYFPWPAQMRDDVQQYRPDVVVVMLGANDSQPLRAPDGSLISLEDSARWKELYRDRVSLLIEEASRYGARVLWVGLPVMANSGYSAGIHRLNELYELEAAEHRRTVYLDTWDMFADPSGGYTPYLRDGRGNLIPIRDSDGVHLTSEGNGMLADAAIDVLRDTWKLAPSAVRD